MFTGIIETLGTVVGVDKDQSNVHLTIKSEISNELKIDQSVAHNGICLTVVALNADTHTVTAIDETIRKTSIGNLQHGDAINLERCMTMNGRLDGHIVQGHVDTVANCISKENKDGSWLFTFEHPKAPGFITVEKGSITVNGISLTVIDPFSTVINPGALLL